MIAAAPFVDAISSNLNADWNDGSFLRCYLDTLHEITGKPILVTATHALKSWDRERGFIPPKSSAPCADLYTSWDRGTLYLGVCAMDAMEPTFPTS